MTETRTRSTFVTVLAWTFIALSGLGTLVSLLQSVMFFALLRGPGFHPAMHAVPEGMPPVMFFLTGHMHWLLLATLAVFALTLASSIGLLKRQEWARLTFVGLMFLAIAWQLFGLVLQWSMSSFMRGPGSFAAPPGAPDMQPFFIGFMVVGVVIALAFCILFGWIAKRLLSAEIAAEFH